MITQRFCKQRFYWKLRKYDLTKFVGKVHSIIYQKNGTQNRRKFWVENDLYRVEEKCKG